VTVFKCGYMVRSLFPKGILVSIIVLFLGLVIWYLVQENGPSSPSALGEKIPPYPVWIKGLTLRSYDGNRPEVTIEADEFKVNPRKFFLFNVRPFNEVTLTNARLKIYLYDKAPSKVDLFPFNEGFLPLKKGRKSAEKRMGIITRGVITGLTLEIYRSDKLSLVIKAQKAYIDLKRKKAEMASVSMESMPAKKLIMSRAVIWDNKEKVFKIPGEYIALTPTGRARGKGIKVDLDFVVNSL